MEEFDIKVSEAKLATKAALESYNEIKESLMQ